MKIRIALVEDHKELREGFEEFIGLQDEFICVDSSSSVEESLEKDWKADVLLLDIGLPGISGTDAITLFKEKYPALQIIMITVYTDEKNIFNAILKGADGYILKDTPPNLILRAIKDGYEGGIPLTPLIAKKALSFFKESVNLPSKDYELSQREIEVLKLLVEGLSNNQIAEKLFISVITVRNHITHIYQKLHVHSKSQAVTKAVKEGLTIISN
jgi:DNA-binding NarL/FixJ family response regulator